MKEMTEEELLKDKRVVAEIQRHLWIESEKAGCDVGFERAKQDWLKNFSKAWMAYHVTPEMIKESRKAADSETSQTSAASKPKAKAKSSSKRRRAKSYLK